MKKGNVLITDNGVALTKNPNLISYAQDLKDDPGPYDCERCGACCAFKWSWPILKPDRRDAKNIPKDMQRDDYPLMKTIGNRCVALGGKLGEKVSCKIYANRPDACKKFTPGSFLCLKARKALVKKSL